MIVKKARFILTGLGALCSLPLLGSSAAEAAPYIACVVQGTNSTGLFTFNHEIYSLECSGEGKRVVAQARSNSDNSGIQVRMRSSTGSRPNAYAFGYNMSQQLIPGCVALDTTSGTSWVTDDCSGLAADDFVKFLTIVVNAE